MEKIYLAIPYTWNPKRSFDIANDVAAKLMIEGKRVFSPISHSHPIAQRMDAELLTNYDFWMNQDAHQVAYADKLICVVIGDMGHNLIFNSRGVQKEIKIAKELNIPIEYYHYMQRNKKMLIVGHARHGKDTVAAMIQELTGAKFKSSSIAAAEIFLYDKLKDKYGYKTFVDCFNDRVNHRAEWHEEIKNFNKHDKARLAKIIMEDNDIYVGMRDKDEINKCIEDKIFDVIIGVFNPRLELEPSSSFNFEFKEVCDYIIQNRGTLEELKESVKDLLERIKKAP